MLYQTGQRYEGTVLGHEVAGIVEELGADVHPSCRIRVGDRVLIYPWFGCQKCSDCEKGYNNLCSINQGGSMDLGLGANAGGYSSHVLVPDVKFAIKVPNAMSLDVACLLPCSAITAYWAILKAQSFIEQAIDVKGRARILVNGIGGLGVWGISLLAAMYKQNDVEIYASDISADKLELAKERGTTSTFLLQPSVTADENADVLLHAANCKFNVVLDFVGAEATVNMAMKVLDKWGTLAVIGLGGGQIAYPLIHLTYNTLTVYGTRTGPLTILPDLIDIVSKADFPKPAIEYYRLHEVNEALDKLRKQQVIGRAVIKH